MALTRKEANAVMRRKYGADWYENEEAMEERDELRRGKKARKGRRKKFGATATSDWAVIDEEAPFWPSRKTRRHRPIKEIANEIGRDWSKNKRGMHFSAVPPFEGMLSLDDIDDMYFSDTGRQVVASFLANAQTWRGPTARKLKAELNQILSLQDHPDLDDGSGSDWR